MRHGGTIMIGLCCTGCLGAAGPLYLMMTRMLIFGLWVFRWSTQRIEHEGRTGMQAQGGYVFWWWQYLWLSFFTMIPYVLESVQQLIPVRRHVQTFP